MAEQDDETSSTEEQSLPDSRQIDHGSEANPHSLWKQISVFLLFALAAIVGFGPWKLIPIVAGACAMGDAWISGIWQRPDEKGFLNIGPAGWGIVLFAIPIIGVPLYFWYRNKLRVRQASNAWWYLTLVFGIVAIFPTVLLLIGGLMHAFGNP